MGAVCFHESRWEWDSYTVIEGDERDEQLRRPSVFCFPTSTEQHIYELGAGGGENHS